jgi:short-subunit dehydrogenase
MSEKTILILGAKSDIGMAVAHRFAEGGYNIQLGARGKKSLEDDRADLELRYDISVTLHEFDVLDLSGHKAFIDRLPELPEVVVCAVGYLGVQPTSERDLTEATLVMRSNYEGPANILAAFANRFEKRGSGIIVGISSVAGERGRATNYVYGSAKAGFTAFLSGLRNRLSKSGVHIVTVLPGFVETKMTQDMDLPAVITAQPHEVANAIFKAVRKRKNIIYVRSVWWLIMLIVRIIPESIFKKLRF